MRLYRYTVFIFMLIAAATASAPVSARYYDDPKPPFNWQELTSSELVVVARYESHSTNAELRDEVRTGGTRDKKQKLSLRVTRVLRGQSVPVGSKLNVELRHRFSVETGPVGFDTLDRNNKSNGIPKLCYRGPYSRFGGLAPGKVVPDVRADVIYFFPTAANLALERKNQVQPALLESGWKQALASRPMDLSFRLAQNVSASLQRDALEQLDASRDARTLDLLFDWLAIPEDERSFSLIAQEALMAIGDRKGDVYNRARKRLVTMPRGWIPYYKMTREQQLEYSKQEALTSQRSRFRKYAHLMAAVDGERAARDFAHMISHSPPALAETAGAWLGYTHSEFAVNLAFTLLQKPETALTGASALRELLEPKSPRSPGERDRMSQASRLQALTLPHLAQAVRSPVFEASRTDAALNDKAPEDLKQMRHNREALEALLVKLEEPAKVDLAHAEQVLLHPNDKTFELSHFGRGSRLVHSEGTALLKSIDAAADPRFIPLLVRLLHDRSPAFESTYTDPQSIVGRYATLYPNAFKRELEKQGVNKAFFEAAPLKGNGFGSRVDALFGRTSFVYYLSRYQTLTSFSRQDHTSWMVRYAASPSLLQEFTKLVEAELDAKRAPRLEAMRFLLFADETTGRPLLERALNLRHEFSRRDSTPLLALAIANGRSELLDELLNAVSAGVEERRARTKQEDTSLQARQSYSISWGPNDVYLHVLLLAKHPKATALYLKILDDTPKTTKSTTGLDFAVYPFTGSDEWVNPTYRGMLQSLFPEHREAFFSCVMVLLRSSSLAEREAGQQALQYALDWDFNFQAKYLARERAARLKTLEPLLQKFGTLTETQMRVLVLKELGINLSNEPQQRLEILLQATSHPDRAVVSNALRLLGILIGEDSPQALEHLPAPVKIRAFKALLADRSLTTESVLQRISFN